MPDTATTEILNRDGSSHRVNGKTFGAMRVAMLAILPDGPPGLTVAEAKAALLPHLDRVLFPGGAKAGWWIKAVQLDHEARGRILRGKGSRVRLFKA
jgi:hypothetical protein